MRLRRRTCTSLGLENMRAQPGLSRSSVQTACMAVVENRWVLFKHKKKSTRTPTKLSLLAGLTATLSHNQNEHIYFRGFLCEKREGERTNVCIQENVLERSA